jgi:glycosyltransferase involved in cell wall biosynthesis
LVEACACCIPWVVTNFCSAEEMITDGINGYVLHNRDEQSFANKMIEALSLNRENVILYNRRFSNLVISNLKENLNQM